MNLNQLTRNIDHFARLATNRLRDSEKGLSEKSKYNIRQEVNNIAADIKAADIKTTTPSKMTPQEFKELAEYWKNKGYAVGTLQNKATIMREILTAAGNKEAAAVKSLKQSLNNKKLTVHGLRHGYAQSRYKALTGMSAPASGGVKYANITDAQKALYDKANEIISKELGHNREEISRAYLGK